MNKKIFNTAFTMGATHVNRLYLQRIAFTMAEILLSLTIIGVVAAITLPSLTGNINERTWEAQRKALYNRLAQALKMMPSLNGYGTYTYTTTNNNVSVTADTAAIAFVTDGLSKVLKLNQVCDSTNLQKCGLPEMFVKPYNISSKTNFPTNMKTLNTYFTDSQYNPQYYINTKAAGFETKNGESVAVFYNPFCTSKDAFFAAMNTGSNAEYFAARKFHFTLPYVCANFIYDLNGKKGPNKPGFDIGVITALYSSDSVIVAPQPNLITLRSGSYPFKTHTQAFNICKTYDNSRLPTLEEMTALAYNWKLFLYQDAMSANWHTNTREKIPNLSDSSHWTINPKTGYAGIMIDSIENKYLCVKGF